MENGADIQAYLADKTGQRTVPNIFIKGQVRRKPRPLRAWPACARRPLADRLPLNGHSTSAARTT
jgi:hypothetical protein